MGEAEGGEGRAALAFASRAGLDEPAEHSVGTATARFVSAKRS